MNTSAPSLSPSAAARARILFTRGGPLLLADWDRAVFLHFEVNPALLQRSVPWPLDLYEGRAFVSLVAFTMRRLRCVKAARLTEWLLKPIGTHPYLNVRTYVRHGGERGILFLAEWMTNPLSLRLGGPAFGLPYRYGQARYLHEPEHGTASGRVSDATGAAFRYGVSTGGDAPRFSPAAPGSLAEFLVERYTCFTRWHGWRRLFRVWHPPWDLAEAGATLHEDGLLEKSGPWFRDATLTCAHLSPGCRDVWMGRPRGVPREPLEE